MKKICSLILLLSLVGCKMPSYSQNDISSIRYVLAEQAKAWNNGNIKGYMQAGYWHNDSLLFIGKSGPTYGYEATLNKYLKSYSTPEQMGILSFSDLKINMLSHEYAFVVGKWALKRSVGDLGGTFTLLFRKINRRWVIVTDHTS